MSEATYILERSEQTCEGCKQPTRGVIVRSGDTFWHPPCWRKAPDGSKRPWPTTGWQPVGGICSECGHARVCCICSFGGAEEHEDDRAQRRNPEAANGHVKSYGIYVCSEREGFEVWREVGGAPVERVQAFPNSEDAHALKCSLDDADEQG